MGFLKFLRRNKAEEIDTGLDDIRDFDMPPPPPDADIGQGNMPDLPPMPDMPEMPELDKEEKYSEEPLEMQKGFPRLSKNMEGDEEDLQPLDEDLPPLDQSLEDSMKLLPLDKQEFAPRGATQRPLFPQPFMQKPLFGNKEYAPKIASQNQPAAGGYYQRLEDSALKEEKALLGYKRAKGPVFVRVERFKRIIAHTSTIRNNAKSAEETIAKLAQIDESREKVFERWHNAILDIQKKFLFIDKTLFKGDKR